MHDKSYQHHHTIPITIRNVSILIYLDFLAPALIESSQSQSAIAESSVWLSAAAAVLCWRTELTRLTQQQWREQIIQEVVFGESSVNSSLIKPSMTLTLSIYQCIIQPLNYPIFVLIVIIIFKIM